MSIFKKYWFQILVSLTILTVFIFISILLSADCSCSSNKIGESVNCFITKTKDLWASIGSIATAISLIFIYLQLKVTKQQILNANKPNLLMNDSIFKISFEKNKIYDLPSKSTKQYEQQINLLGEYQGISLTNVGLGTAKSIVVSWTYNKKLVEERKADFFRPSSNIQNINYLSKDDVYTIYPPFDYLASIITEDRFVVNIPYAKSEEEEKGSVIDVDRHQKQINTDNELKLKLSYRDIYGNVVPQEFIVKVLAITQIVEPNTYFVKLIFDEKITCK